MIIAFFAPLLMGISGLITPLQGQFWLNWQGLWHTPAIGASIALTLWIGLSATLFSLWGCFTILTRYAHSKHWRRLEARLSPLLAFPHVAMAMGLVLLLSPSGWLYRLFAHFGWYTGNFWSPIQDEWGIGLILVLVLKETPFLLLMSAALLPQLKSKTYLKAAQQLGYSPLYAWQKTIFPLWLPKMRLPIFAVLGYNLSVVDIAMIIGPTRPAPFAIRIWQWVTEPNLSYPNLATLGALALFALILMVFVGWWLVEYTLLNRLKHWQYAGALAKKTAKYAPILWPSLWIIPLILVPLLGVWSVSLRWHYPDWLPTTWTFRFWQQQTTNLLSLIDQSVWLALASTGLALLGCVILLEHRHRFQKGIPLWCVALPLIVPALSILLGMQMHLYQATSPHYAIWVLWGHLFFVFPYVYLTLNGAWLSYDKKWDRTAYSLGYTPWQTFWRVRRVQLMSAIWLGVGVGISVSLAQYLPTQLLGAGRINTLTTQAVALASGQDQRISAIYALLQGLLPLIFFVITLFFSQRHSLHDTEN